MYKTLPHALPVHSCVPVQAQILSSMGLETYSFVPTSATIVYGKQWDSTADISGMSDHQAAVCLCCYTTVIQLTWLPITSPVKWVLTG